MFCTHPESNTSFWIDECELVASNVTRKSNPQYANLPRPMPASIDTILAELGKKDLSTAKEKHLRIRLWWLWNNLVRTNQKTNLIDSVPHFKGNLEKLSNLITNETHQSRLMSAEIFRELGQFDTSLKKLDHDFPSPLSEAAQVIQAACKNKNRDVQKLT